MTTHADRDRSEQPHAADDAQEQSMDQHVTVAAGQLNASHLGRTVDFHWQGGDYSVELLGFQNAPIAAAGHEQHLSDLPVQLLVASELGPQWLDFDAGQPIRVAVPPQDVSSSRAVEPAAPDADRVNAYAEAYYRNTFAGLDAVMTLADDEKDATRLWWMQRYAVLATEKRAAERALADERAKVADWQQKWKKRGLIIDRLRDDLRQAQTESAEHLALIEGKTALALIQRDRAALAGPAEPEASETGGEGW